MGYGVVDSIGSDILHIASGTLAAKRSLPVGKRLSLIHSELFTLIENWKPDVIAIEAPFVPGLQFGENRAATSIKSSIAVGQAQAVALMAAAANDIPSFSYAPTEVKYAVTHYGRGSKEQVSAMIQLIIGIDTGSLPTDETDALAVALCHIRSEKLRRLTE